MSISSIMESAPKQYLCPLSDVVMTKPMKHETTGIRFDQEAILMDWIKKGNDTCPITGEPLTASELVLDTELAAEIEVWRQGKLKNIRDRILNRRQDLMNKSREATGTGKNKRTVNVLGGKVVAGRNFSALSV